jgi:hypothetical protein
MPTVFHFLLLVGALVIVAGVILEVRSREAAWSTGPRPTDPTGWSATKYAGRPVQLRPDASEAERRLWTEAYGARRENDPRGQGDPR